VRKDRLVRSVLACLLFVGVAGLLWLQCVELRRSAGRRIGMTPAEGATGLVVAAVFRGEPAERAGLRAGDRILAIDGRPVATAFAYEKAAGAFQPGRPVPFLIERSGGIRAINVIPGFLEVIPGTHYAYSDFLWQMDFILCLSVMGYLSLAFLALTRDLRDVRVLLLFLLCAAIGLELALPNPVGQPLLRTLGLAGVYLLFGLQVGIQLHLASTIPDRPGWLRERPWIVHLYYVLGGGLGIVSCGTFLAEWFAGHPVFPWNGRGLNGLLISARLGVAIAVTGLLVGQVLRQSEARARHQAGLVLASVTPWMLLTLGARIFTRLAFFERFEALILLAYPVAVSRYYLFKVDSRVRRSVIYSLLTGALVLAFYGSLGIGGSVLSHLALNGGESVWIIAGGTLLLGFLFAPLRRLLHGMIERRFFPETFSLRERLIALAGELGPLGKLPRMGSYLVERVTSIFTVRSACLMIADPESGFLSVLASTGKAVAVGSLIELNHPAMERLRRAGRPLSARKVPLPSSFLHRHGVEPSHLIVPLVHHKRLIGLLILGGKQRGGDFSTEELDLLILLASHVSIVIENARLYESATYEGLTGLLRREAILEQLDREVERAFLHQRPLTIAMADLDHFKEINDRLGHLSGDLVLRRTGRAICEGLRSTDWIGRYGGEEFLLVLPETEIEGALAVAEKVRTLVEGCRERLEDGTLVSVTISIGLASLSELSCPRGERVTGRDLIAAADRSLYEAKRAGRNRVCPRVA
jgi:diguanylate cyclase (GGDEF)-like protein